jgi:hypothetical protein
MAHFFLSVPGLVVCAGIGALLLLPPPRRRIAAPLPGDPLRTWMQIAVSAVILAAGLWVILSGRYDADAQQWAAGAIGTVVGYWLKP